MPNPRHSSSSLAALLTAAGLFAVEHAFVSTSQLQVGWPLLLATAIAICGIWEALIRCSGVGRWAGAVGAVALGAVVVGLTFDRVFENSKFAAESWRHYAVLAVAILSGVAALLAYRLTGRLRGGKLLTKILGGAALTAVAPACLWLDQNLFVRRYEELHRLLIIAVPVTIRAAFHVWRVRTPSFLSPTLAILVGATTIGTASAWFFGLAPGDDPAARRFLLVDAPIASRWGALFAKEESIEVSAEWRDRVAARPRTDAARLDALWPERRRFNVVFITVDTVRADHVKHLGYHRATTPEIDRLATEGTTFEAAYAQYPSSRLSMASMFTGRYPTGTLVHKRRGPQSKLLIEKGGLPVRLKEAGYQTKAITALNTDLINRIFQYLPHWFDEFNPYPHETLLDAPEITRHAIAALPDPSSEPFLLWVHYFDPHDPYVPRGDDEWGERPIDLYDREILWTDGYVGKFLDTLRSRPDYDRTVVIIHSDHGEEFYDHGGQYHHSSLFDEQIHVPLVIRVPGAAARRVKNPVGLVDLTPTIADLLGLPENPERHGSSLVPLLLGEQPSKESVAFAQFREAHIARSRLAAVRVGDWKLIRDLNTKTSELYHLARDPNEQQDLALAEQETATRLLGWVNAYEALAAGSLGEASNDKLAQQIEHGTSQERLKVISTFMRRGSDGDLDQALRTLVADPELTPGLGGVVLKHIARRRLTDLVPALIRRSRSPEFAIARGATQALGLLGGAEALAHLRGETPSNEGLKRSWITARATAGDDSVAGAVEALVATATRDELYHLVFALARSGPPEYAGMLSAAVEHGTLPWDLSATGLHVLAQPENDQLSLTSYGRFRAGPALNREMHRVMGDVITRFEVPGAVPLLRLALTSSDSKLRERCAKHLAESGHEAWSQALIAASESARLAVDAARAGKDSQRAAEILLDAYETAASAGLCDWGLVIDAWWFYMEAGQREKATSLTGNPDTWPLFALEHLKRLKTLASKLSQGPNLKLEWAGGTQLPIGGRWVAVIKIVAASDAGALQGYRWGRGANVRLRFFAADGALLQTRLIPLAMSGLLPGEQSLTLLTATLAGPVQPATVKIDVIVSGRSVSPVLER